MLQNFCIKAGDRDRWRWKGSSNGMYSVKETYKEIAKRSSTLAGVNRPLTIFKDIWKLYTPFKVQLLQWRLVRDRLPMKVSLRKRNLIEESKLVCCCCGEKPESTSHLFVECAKVDELWSKVIGWVGACWAEPREVVAHFGSFSMLLVGGDWPKRLGDCGCA